MQKRRKIASIRSSDALSPVGDFPERLHREPDLARGDFQDAPPQPVHARAPQPAHPPCSGEAHAMDDLLHDVARQALTRLP